MMRKIRIALAIFLVAGALVAACRQKEPTVTESPAPSEYPTPAPTLGEIPPPTPSPSVP